MTPDEFNTYFDNAFNMPGFDTMYPDIMERYKLLGFTDPLTDADKLKEAKWITEQIRKFVNTKKAPWHKMLERPEAMLANVNDVIEKSKEYPDNRQEMIYMQIKADWLFNFKLILEEYIGKEEEEVW